MSWVCVPAIPSGWEQTGNDRLDQVRPCNSRQGLAFMKAAGGY